MKNENETHNATSRTPVALQYEQPGSAIRERAFQFSVRVVRLCNHLDEKPGSGRTLARQLLRSATSIGANLEEAHAAYSKADFLCKACIALKEAREMRYWLRLIAAAELVSVKRIHELQVESDELARIVGAIVVATRQKQRSKQN